MGADNMPIENILAAIAGGVGQGLSSYTEARERRRQMQQEAYERAMQNRMRELQMQQTQQAMKFSAEDQARQNQMWEYQQPALREEARYHTPLPVPGSLGYSMAMYERLGKAGQTAEDRAWQLEQRAQERKTWPEETEYARRRTGAMSALEWRRRNQPFPTARGEKSLTEMTLPELTRWKSTVSTRLMAAERELQYLNEDDETYGDVKADYDSWVDQAGLVDAEIANKRGLPTKADATSEQIGNLKRSGLTRKQARAMLKANRTTWTTKYDIGRLEAAVEALP